MTVVDNYQQQTQNLAAASATQVAAIYAALQAGQITTEVAVQLIAAVVNTANAAATTLADASMSVQVEQAAGVPTPTTGVAPVDDIDRLTKGVSTILAALQEPPESPDAPEDPAQTAQMRLERMARSEPLETGQNASVQAMAQQPLVEGWTRQMDADPCQLCRWWWRDGRIWPKNHPFQSHKGCNCQPKVVLAQHIQSTQYTRRLERNAR